jgi:hypothetical protein
LAVAVRVVLLHLALKVITLFFLPLHLRVVGLVVVMLLVGQVVRVVEPVLLVAHQHLLPLLELLIKDMQGVKILVLQIMAQVVVEALVALGQLEQQR